MFRNDYIKTSDGAAAKVSFMNKDPLAYFIMSMMAGAFIGVGVLLAFTAGGLMTGLPYAKVVMGLSFGVALSLVVMAGAELFTGNNLAMAAGLLDKKVSWKDAVKLWCICWTGNLLGSMVFAGVYSLTGLCTGPVGEFMVSAAAAKMGAGAMALFTRGILCNFLVCLAVWCAGRAASDAGKLIMVFWCLFAFITTGFEHSIANMTLFTVALLQPVHEAVSIGGFFYNLLMVTIGNMAGGILFVAVPYYIAGRRDK